MSGASSMDQSVATAAGSGPLTADAARVLDAVDAPVLVVARSGSIAYANDPARLLLTREDPSRTIWAVIPHATARPRRPTNTRSQAKSRRCFWPEPERRGRRFPA